MEMVNDSDVIVIMIVMTMIAIVMMIIIIIVMIILIIMVEVLSNLQFNFHHKLPLENFSKWLKS